MQDTTIEVYEDEGDFIDDEDFAPSETTFYQGVCGEEIFREEMVSSTRNETSRKTKATILRI
ncbi:hypothetical protein GmHk_13G036489 [Glycine max]|nr:hypothetical protein GmHk_13G036489 [Glycine max]